MKAEFSCRRRLGSYRGKEGGFSEEGYRKWKGRREGGFYKTEGFFFITDLTPD